MRKLMLAALGVLPLGLGCAHTGGICDCAPVPGDSTGYNPHVTYHATCPGCDAPPPLVASTSTVSTGNGGTFEQIGSPKTMPNK
jgi:hypothetical protein